MLIFLLQGEEAIHEWNDNRPYVVGHDCRVSRFVYLGNRMNVLRGRPRIVITYNRCIETVRASAAELIGRFPRVRNAICANVGRCNRLSTAGCTTEYVM